MSYKFSSNTIPRVQAYLDEMAKFPDVLDFKHPNPVKLARWLAEALSLGNKIKDSTLIDIRSKYKIRVLNGRVRVELRDIPVEIANPRMPETLTVNSVVTLKEIIGAVIHHRAASIEFPNAELDEHELTRLTTWAKTENLEVSTTPKLRVYKNG